MRARRWTLAQTRGEGRALFRTVGYLACAWALAFAALSFYWAAGGTAGGATIGPELQGLGLARDPGFVAILWATGVLKVFIGVLALALTQPWGRRDSLLGIAVCRMVRGRHHGLL